MTAPTAAEIVQVPRSLLRRVVMRTLAALVAVNVVGVLAIVAADRVRRRRSIGRGSGHTYPWESYPPVVVEQAREDEATGVPVAATTVRLFAAGDELYEEMLVDIAAARETIELETFIWKDDRVGHRVLDALHERARAGVHVRVIFDAFANLVVPRRFKDFPSEIDTLEFRPMEGPADFCNPRYFLRDHRKLLVIDRQVGYVGGYNIGEPYAVGTWRDTHARVTGPAVGELRNAFADFWNLHRSSALRAMPDEPRRTWMPAVRIHRNDPALRIFPIRGMYLESIDRATSHVYLTHAYFVPDRAFRRALVDACARGVDVRVLVPGASNHVLADWLGRRWFGELLDAGVRMYWYRDMIHAKTATIDGIWSTVGTANIDRFSLLGNYEVNLEVTGAALAEQMERMFELDCSHAVEVTGPRWHARPLRTKMLERAVSGTRWFV